MPTFNRRQILRGALALWVPAPGWGATSRIEMLYGTATAPTSPIQLTAGPLSLLFEPDLAFVRFIRFNGQEVLRGIYAAVRDKSWGTVAPKVSNLIIERKTNQFTINFDVDCAEGDIKFQWKGRVVGDDAGSVRFEFKGIANSTFLRNRIGFAVLHPLESCAGKKAKLEKSNGALEQGSFPASVSPSQPFIDLRAITHAVAPGIDAEVRFEGDSFETEDHRNWTDGNFKTYCTPLANPFPVEVKRGTEIQQAVTVRIQGAAANSANTESSGEIVFSPTGSVSKLPALGLGYVSGMPPLGALNVAHIRVDLVLNQPGHVELLLRAIAETAASKTGLELAVFVSSNADSELKALAKAVTGARVARYLIFHIDEPSTSEKWLRLAKMHLKGAPVGGGTNQYFAELNRSRPAVDAVDFASYSINPQVHAFDNLSLVENLSSQGDTVKSARMFLGSKGIVVSPVTLRPRFNQFSKQPTPPDPRMASLFGAAWTLGSVKYLSEAGASSVTYYETHGKAGAMASRDTVFPLYHVLADVSEFAGGEVLATESNDRFKAAGMLLRKGARQRAVVANFTPELQLVRWNKSGFGARVRVKSLDEHSYEEATKTPHAWRTKSGLLFENSGDLLITLLPYAVLRIDPA